MKQISEAALEVELMLQLWRDINIAISRKYLRKDKERFHHDKEDWDEKGEDEIADM